MAQHERITEYVKANIKTVQCDVLVAGGGIAGVMAALASARQGAETILIENSGSFGGVVVAWGLFCFCADTKGQGRIFDELLEYMEQLGAIASYQDFNAEEINQWNYYKTWGKLSVAREFDPNGFQICLCHMVSQQKRLKALLHTRVVDANAEDGVVNRVLVHNGSELFVIEPGAVVDCTGDAVLANAAGFECIRNREKDGRSIPMSLLITLKKSLSGSNESTLPQWCRHFKDEKETLTTFSRKHEGRVLLRENIVGYDPTDAAQKTEAGILSRTNIPGIVQYFQQHGYADYELEQMSTELSVRIGRRVKGEYVLEAEDLRNCTTFDDAVAQGSANLSSFLDPDHINKGHNQTHEAVKAYQIPLRCLVPKSAKNLLAAGRCISADWLSLSSARMVPTCAMTGLAAGYAAAKSVNQKTAVLKVDIEELKKELRDNGAVF